LANTFETEMSYNINMQIYVLNDNSRKTFKGMYNEPLFVQSNENVFALGIVEDGKPAGILVSYVFLDEIAIQWMYVAEEFRRKGIASKLVQAIIFTAKKSNVSDIYMTFIKDELAVEAILKKNGFTVHKNPNWMSFEATIADLKTVSEEDVRPVTLSSFMTVGMAAVEEFNKYISKSASKIGVPLSVDPRDYSPFSCCSLVDGKIDSLLLVDTNEKGDLVEMPWIYLGKNASDEAPAMYNATINALKATYEPETRLVVNCIDASMDKAITKVLPKAKTKEVCLATLSL